MTDTIDDIEKKALQLSEAERARLASAMIRSLPGTLHDEDEGLAEASRCFEELQANPSLGISLDQLNARIRRPR